MTISVAGMIAVLLTIWLFGSRERMIGYLAAIWWAVLAGLCYAESAAAWDIQYISFFGSIGGFILCVLGMYGMREKHDSIGDESMERSGGAFMDEADDIDTADVEKKRGFSFRRGNSDDDGYNQDAIDDIFSTDSDESDARKRAVRRRSSLHDRAEARRRVRG